MGLQVTDVRINRQSLDRKIRQAAERATEAAGEVFAENLEQDVPVDTGQLRDSIEVLPAESQGTSVFTDVIVGAPYARFVDDQQPFFEPTWQQSLREMETALRRELRKETSR